ncbi:NUDIX hydrolase domain-like protein [Lipomyces oligophaga]|uniref:NUDIX hydrolase domain-like protein n=1 Tax=Lipomyces oligophaga TaxID=45792 RepID=UPI0034CE3667
MSTSRPMAAREGREHQRYSPSGARLVAGVIALSKDRTKVLLVTSTGREDKLVVPKGGYETDEPTPEAAALREAWEEAGVEGKLTRSLGVIEDSRPPKAIEQVVSFAPKAEYYFFEMDIESEAEIWPESDRRTRHWLTYSQAKESLIWRPDLLEALNRSNINKDL